MTEITVWPARRVGDEFRCGRVVDGRQRCPGVIAWVDDMMPTKQARTSRSTYDPSTVEQQLPGFEYEQDDGIANVTGILHLRNKARPRPRRGGAPAHFIAWPVADFPFTRKCPQCASVARVDSTVLHSGQ